MRARWLRWLRRPGSIGESRAAPLPAPSAALALIEEGHVFESTGRWLDAMACYDAAVRADPTLARAQLNRGNALAALDDESGAIAAYERALELERDHIGATFNLGNLHLRRGRPQQALAFLERVLVIDPSFVDAYVSAGVALDDLRRFDEAAARYRQALVLQPNFAEVHANLGATWRNAGRFDAAVASYRASLALSPSRVETHVSLAMVLQDLGDLAGAEASYRRAVAMSPDDAGARSGLLLLANYQAIAAPALLLDEARRFGAIVTANARPFGSWLTDWDPDRELHVGVVSGDLRAHPVGFFFEAVAQAMARRAVTQLRITAYTTYPCNDDVAQRIAAAVRDWVPVVGTTDAFFAGRIHADRVDVLIDLSGHTAHNRLPVFAWRPAPLAVTWLGYFATTGVVEIDHLLADPVSLPPSEEPWFTESIRRLPETRLCFTAPDEDVEPNDLPAVRRGFITLGCFNNLTKVTDDVIALWSRVMHALPRSELLLKSPQLGEASVQHRIAGAFEARGIEPSRLRMEGLSARADYLRRYHDIDFALDPFPFPGGTTTVESLWMGVPVLTMRGERFLSRQGAALLTSAGLTDWIAADRDIYVDLAVRKAGDLVSLAALRSRLRRQIVASPLFNADRFSDAFEAELRGLWRARCAKAVSSVAPLPGG